MPINDSLCWPEASRQEELTARLMGHTDPKMTSDLKMKAFYESPYGNNTLATMMNSEVSSRLIVQTIQLKPRNNNNNNSPL